MEALTEDIVLENERLAGRNKEEEEKLRSEYEKKLNAESREKCYKRLMILLGKSKLYAQIMKQKMQKEEEEAARKLKRAQEKADKGKKDSKKNGPILEEKACVKAKLKEDSSVKLEKSDIENMRSVLDSKMSVLSNNRGESSKSDSKTDGHNINPKKRLKLYTVQNIKDIIDYETINTFEMQAHVKTETNDEKALHIKQPKLFDGGTLREYQLIGFSWLKSLYENGMNGILADEMGLGKTLQVIAMICHMISADVPGPFLVIAPLSTLPNWISEFNRFAPKVPVLLFHGNETIRNAVKKDIKKRVQDNSHKHFPVVLTSFEVVLREVNYLCKFSWDYLVVDEGHRLKNYKCQLASALKNFISHNRLILTGTPLQNNLTELWSLLNFILPDLFTDIYLFEALFDVTKLQGDACNEEIIKEEQEKHVISTIHEILSPFMLRRVKSEVDIEIPPKKELLVYAPMTDLQMKLYEAVLQRNLSLLTLEEEKVDNPIIPDGPDGKRQKRKRKPTKYNLEDLFSQERNSQDNESLCSFSSESDAPSEDLVLQHENYYVRVKMQNSMMMLRKIVNHPYLVHFPLRPGTKEFLIDDNIISSSGKLLVVDAILNKLKARGHKVLLFSTFTMVLDILEEYAIMRGYVYCRLDGKCSLENRCTSIQEFNVDKNVFLFLLSTRAAGLGINLTAADTVIIFDSDWNPQVDLQAQDRCHRIGQNKPVVVYRLITKGTVDEKIVERAGAKRKLEKLIIQKGKFAKTGKNKSSVNSVTPQELLELLNSKDHHGTIHSNGFVYTDEELEKLLDRSDLMGK